MRVRWTAPALADLEDIEDFIAQDSPRAAYALINNLMDRSERLLMDNPNSGRSGRVPGTRELVISGTPYIVVYRVRTAVEIVAVFHGAREWPESFG